MTVEFEDLVDAIVKIGNDHKVSKLCEPNVMQPLRLKHWMVKRTLVAWGLFLREAQKKG